MDYSIEQLHKIFPEAQDIIDYKINELTRKYTELSNKMLLEKKLCNIHQSKDDNDITRWFCKFMIDNKYQFKLQDIDYYIHCLRRNSLRRDTDGIITEQMIENAKQIPIESLINCDIKRSHKKLKILCPFHKEKTASLIIYLENNSFYCFGCSIGGDNIHFYMHYNNCGFKTAVLELLSK
jgi:hypothetical protein